MLFGHRATVTPSLTRARSVPGGQAPTTDDHAQKRYPHAPGSTGEPERIHFSRSISLVQKRGDAVVDGKGFQRAHLARAEGVLWQGAVPAAAYRHGLRISGKARVS